MLPRDARPPDLPEMDPADLRKLAELRQERKAAAGEFDQLKKAALASRKRLRKAIDEERVYLDSLFEDLPLFPKNSQPGKNGHPSRNGTHAAAPANPPPRFDGSVPLVDILPGIDAKYLKKLAKAGLATTGDLWRYRVEKKLVSKLPGIPSDIGVRVEELFELWLTKDTGWPAQDQSKETEHAG